MLSFTSCSHIDYIYTVIRNKKSILNALHFKFDSLKLMHPAYTCFNILYM